MRSYGPKSLLKVGKERLIVRQLRILREVFPGCEVVVVLGFEADRIRKYLPSWVRVVFNDEYETTNVARSIAIGLKSCRHERVLVVYGDLAFDCEALAPFKERTRSCVLVDTLGLIRDGEVGVNVVEDRALYFSYGLDAKWAQLALLTGREKHLFQKLAFESDKSRFFGYEILNLLLEDDGTSLDAISPAKMAVAEVDCTRDLENATSLLTSC